MVISGSMRNRRQRQGPERLPCVLEVSGVLVPDVTGCYVLAGTYASQPYYKHRTLQRYIWYDSTTYPGEYWWQITDELGVATGPAWYRWDNVPIAPAGEYLPWQGATGTATVIIS